MIAEVNHLSTDFCRAEQWEIEEHSWLAATMAGCDAPPNRGFLAKDCKADFKFGEKIVDHLWIDEVMTELGKTDFCLN